MPRLGSYGNIRIILIVLVALLVLLYVLVLLRPRDLSRFFSRFAFKGKAKRLVDFGISFQEGIKRTSKKALIVVMGLFLLRFVIDAFFLYFVLLGFGHKVNLLYLLYSKNVAYVVGTISMIPTGLGSSDLTFMFFLSKLDIPKQVILSCVLVDRLLYTLLPFLIGLISANILGVEFLKRKKGEALKLNRLELNHQQARTKQN
jgi:phosphatidylglycerol lysyltransferase